MAGLKNPHLTQALRRLRDRGIRQGTLAEALGTSRSYVSRVMTGEQREGAVAQRLFAWLREHGHEDVAELLAQVKFTGVRHSYGRSLLVREGVVVGMAATGSLEGAA